MKFITNATKFASAAKGFLAAKVVPIVGTVLVLIGATAIVQTWRIDGLKDDIANANALRGVCKAENALNEAAFDEINAAAERRLAQAQAAREAAELTAKQARERRNADIDKLAGRIVAIRDAYESADSDCDCNVPDDVDRMLRAGTPYSRDAGDENGDPVRPDPG